MLASSSVRVVLLALAAAAPVCVAKPVRLASRDAVAPPITNPTAQTVWRVGETQTVTWDVAALNGAPPSNPQASIILGTLSADGNEHLQFETPLVSGFPILGGNITLIVPPVPSGSNYIVCLFGTSDDISPAFAIVGTDASSSSSAAAASSGAPSSTAASSITAATTPSPPSSVLASTSTAGPTSQAGAPRASSQTSAAAAPATTAEATVTSVTTAPLGSAPSSVPGTAGGASPNAAAAQASSSSGAAPTSARTSGGLRSALTRAHRWGVGCALAFALALV
ncbi:hypothetical protein BD413DRAFT_604526 [Trametes elegans]|nr:hypothetical protein BD413DRAFT_604526 [Trametes elegans]